MPTAHEIFTKEVFEKQNNGTIFYKEGKLQDFPYAGPGIFQSWRYNFDSGKQVFRAEKTGKVFEKRLIKDQYGNPKWTGWIEVPDAEAHGIQAIAVNDRPLQLPNTDGALKLQITPASIDTYTKKEIYDLIGQKISDNENNKYTYVAWCLEPGTTDWAANPKRVLEITFGPEGGIKDHFYLVEPHPGTSGVQEKATYWIWDEDHLPNGTVVLAWIEVDASDLRAFISYPVFYEHVDDFEQHLSGQFERDKWNDAYDTAHAVSGELIITQDRIDTEVDTLNARIDDEVSGLNISISGVEKRLDEHILDRDGPNSLHWGALDRENFERLLDHEMIMPLDGDRYVGQNGDWVKAYEQVDAEPRQSHGFFIVNGPIASLKDGDSFITGIKAKVNEFLGDYNTIVGYQLEIGGFMPDAGTLIKFVTDTGIESPTYTVNSGATIWTIPYDTDLFDTISIKLIPPELNGIPRSTTLTGHVKFYIHYRKVTGVKVGDPGLLLNLIGPPFDAASGIEPMYNGVPLSKLVPDAAKTAEWGKISGYISNQTDIREYFQQFVDSKVNKAPLDSNLRYEIFKNGVIPGLIQQPNAITQTHTLKYGDASHIAVDTVIFSGIAQTFQDLIDDGHLPYHARLKVQFVASYDDETGDTHGFLSGKAIPVYFKTDNDEIADSAEVASGPFVQDWPGVASGMMFDKIILKGWNVEHLDNCRLEISTIKHTDAYFKNNPYDIYIESKEIILNAESGIHMNATSGGVWDLGTGQLTELSSGRLIDTKDGDFTVITQNAGINAKDNIVLKTENIRTDVTTDTTRAVTIRELATTKRSEISGYIINSDKLNVTANTQVFSGIDVTQIAENIKIEATNIETETENYKLISNETDIISDNANITISGQLDITTNDLNTIVENDVVTEIINNKTEKIGNNFVTTVGNNSMTLVHGDSTAEINKNLIVKALGNIDVTAGDDFALTAENKINIISQDNDISLGKSFDYDDATKKINVYGQEIDSRYVDRDVVDKGLALAGVSLTGGNKIVQDITFDYDEDTGALSLRKVLISLKDGSVDVFSGIDLDLFTETEAKELSGLIDTEIKRVARIISGELYKKVDKKAVDNALYNYYSGLGIHWGPGNKIVQDITFTLEDSSGNITTPEQGILTFTKTLVSLEDESVDVYKETFDLVTEFELGLVSGALNNAIDDYRLRDEEEALYRISGDAYLQSEIDNIHNTIGKEIYEPDFGILKRLGDVTTDLYTRPLIDYISGQWYENTSGDPNNPTWELRNYEDISGIDNRGALPRLFGLDPAYPDPKSIVGRLKDAETTIIENYNDINIKLEKVVNEGTESYDLIILTNNDLTEAIENGDFENAKRILIDRDVTEYIPGSNPVNTLDFSNIEYLHGEERCTIDLRNLIFENYDSVYFDTIILHGNNAVTINSEERRCKEIELNGGTQTIPLTKYYDIYRLDLVDDTNVVFDNVLEGKEYIFYVYQPDVVKQFSIGNPILNAPEFLVPGPNTDPGRTSAFEASTQEPYFMTVIKAIGTKEPTNSFIVTDVIVNADKNYNNTASIKVKLGNTLAQIHVPGGSGTAKFDDCVIVTGGINPITKESSYPLGSIVTMEAIRNNSGWENITVNFYYEGSDPITASLSGGPQPLGYKFTIPNDAAQNIMVDFGADPVLVDVLLSKDIAAYYQIDSISGFTDDINDIDQKYQVFYNEITLNIKAKDEYFLWSTENGVGDIYALSMPWKFTISHLPRSLNTGLEIYTLYITPKFYVKIDEITSIKRLQPPSIGGNFLIQNDIAFILNDLVDYNEFTYNYTLYLTTPLQSEDVIDPIVLTQIIDPSTGLPFLPTEVKNLGTSDSITKAKFFILTDPSDPNDYVELEVRTASGKIFNLKVKAYDAANISDAYIKEIGGEPVFYKGTVDATHTYTVDWGGSPPSIETGAWSTDDSNITLVEVGNDCEVTVPGNMIGKNLTFKLIFTPDIDSGNPIEAIIKIHQLPDSVEIRYNNSPAQAILKTSDKVQLTLNWDPQEQFLTNPTGIWSVNSAHQDYAEFEGDGIQTGLLTIKNLTSSTPIEIQFVATDLDYNGVAVEDTFTFTIIANDYLLSFIQNDDEENYIGVTFTHGAIMNNGEVAGGTAVVGRILLKAGYTIDDDTEAALLALHPEPLANYSPPTVVKGNQYADFTFNMMFEDTIIHVGSKLI